MYCPKCAATATPGQRFCRACGTDLGVIVDAMEGKRGPIDFESLKSDLRALGTSLRAGFEEAKQGFDSKVKTTGRLTRPKAPRTPRQKPIPIQVKNIRAGNTRRYSLQQGLLSIFSGGATAGTLYWILKAAASSGLLTNLESELALHLNTTNVVGVASVVEVLWVLGLIPAVKGVAHLFNGIFFPVKLEPAVPEVVVHVPQKLSFTPVSSPAVETPPQLRDPETNELAQEQTSSPEPQASVTEDETIRFGAR